MEATIETACTTRQDYELYKIFSAINIFISISNVTTNGLLSHVLWRRKMLNTTSYRFIFVQSITDILVGITMLISRSAFYFVPATRFCDLKAYNDIVCDTLCMFSAVMVTLVASDRYIHMRFLTQYSAWMTKNRGIALVIFNAIMCLALGGLQAVAYLGNWYSLILFILNSSAIFFIVTTSVAYFSAYKSLYIRTKQIDYSQSIPNISNRKSRKNKRSREFLKSMVVILSSFIMCFTPFVIASALKIACRNQDLSESIGIIIFFYISRLLTCMNSSLNALLYISLNRQLKSYALNAISFGYWDEISSITAAQESRPERVACTINSAFV